MQKTVIVKDNDGEKYFVFNIPMAAEGFKCVSLISNICGLIIKYRICGCMSHIVCVIIMTTFVNKGNYISKSRASALPTLTRTPALYLNVIYDNEMWKYDDKAPTTLDFLRFGGFIINSSDNSQIRPRWTVFYHSLPCSYLPESGTGSMCYICNS